MSDNIDNRMVWVEVFIDDQKMIIKSPKGGEISITHSMIEEIPDRRLKNVISVLSELYNKGLLNKSNSHVSVNEMKTLYNLASKHDSIIQ